MHTDTFKSVVLGRHETLRGVEKMECEHWTAFMYSFHSLQGAPPPCDILSTCTPAEVFILPVFQGAGRNTNLPGSKRSNRKMMHC